MRVLIFCLVAALTPVALLAGDSEPVDDPTAGLTDWLSIPDFTIEIALGTTLGADGQLVGETFRFPKNVGTVYCRVDGIGIADKQKLTLVWYREDAERERQTVAIAKAAPAATGSLNILAAQAGSWRVEVVDAKGRVLAVAPFVVGKPSITDVPAPKGVQPIH